MHELVIMDHDQHVNKHLVWMQWILVYENAFSSICCIIKMTESEALYKKVLDLGSRLNKGILRFSGD